MLLLLSFVQAQQRPLLPVLRTSRRLMSSYAVPAPPETLLPVTGSSSLQFPVRRIYCVGRNFADHAREMGSDPIREPPFFFTKPRDAAVSTTSIPYPPATENLHHEVELVVAIGADEDSSSSSTTTNSRNIYGLATGVDLTRRDLQAAAKKTSRPWDCAKGFDQSAPVSAVTPLADCSLELQALVWGETSACRAEIWLDVNGERKQTGKLCDMIWSIPEIVTVLSQQFRLQPGDLIFTGTPSGVGPLIVGDSVHASVDGLDPVRFDVCDPIEK